MTLDLDLWDLEIGRRCYDALSVAQIRALLALTEDAIPAWLDANLPEHRELIRAAYHRTATQLNGR